jgi:hypothetical protein
MLIFHLNLLVSPYPEQLLLSYSLMGLEQIGTNINLITGLLNGVLHSGVIDQIFTSNNGLGR